MQSMTKGCSDSEQKKKKQEREGWDHLKKELKEEIAEKWLKLQTKEQLRIE